ncbi:hypothetical protein DPMN_048513 [Dreissena polymorpha]|uniref:Uncharacterized protein n=1 Tax=Dreissena polymorpha TaxID=45954 RepID=A0A9D4DCJ5_DREPO|nr:hypothetical protein DPMN_048513 [Dreissena polymorpha]
MLLRRFHDDWTKYVTSIALTICHYNIIRTHFLNKFHEDWKKVSLRVLTRFHYSHALKTAWPPDKICSSSHCMNTFCGGGGGGGVLTNHMRTNGRRTKTNSKTSPEQSAIFQLCSITRKTAPPPKSSHIHDDFANNVTSRVFTSFFLLYKYKKTAPLQGSTLRHVRQTLSNIRFGLYILRGAGPMVLLHVIQLTGTREKCPAHWWPCFSPIWTIFELVRDIN